MLGTKMRKIPILLQRKVLYAFLLPGKGINLLATFVFHLINKIPGLVKRREVQIATC
jgi:hypothetical protein